MLSTLFWLLVPVAALVAAWRVICLSATFPLPDPPRDEPPVSEPPRRRRRPQNV